MGEGDERNALVVTQTAGCPSCGLDHPEPKIQVAHIRSGAYDWSARGTVEAERTCVSCGQVYNVVEELIPLECAEYACPRCGSTAKLRYKVLGIDRVSDGYEFSASIECTKCKRRSVVKRVLTRLTKITRLKIGPTGVEVERQV